MRSRRENGPLIARTSAHSIGRRTPDRAHRHAPRLAHHRVRRSTPHHVTHLARLHVRRSNRIPALALTPAAHRHPAARHARPNARRSPDAMRDRKLATIRGATGATAHHPGRARAIARARQNRSNATRAIANPIARRSLPRRASRSARPRGPWKGQPSAHRNGRRSARPNQSAATWHGLFVTMATTSAAHSTIKPKPRPAACACRSA